MRARVLTSTYNTMPPGAVVVPSRLDEALEAFHWSPIILGERIVSVAPLDKTPGLRLFFAPSWLEPLDDEAAELLAAARSVIAMRRSNEPR